MQRQERETSRKNKGITEKVKELFFENNSRKSGRKNVRSRTLLLNSSEILKCAITTLFSYFLGRAPAYFNTYPLCNALICSMTRRVGWAALGGFLGGVANGEYIWGFSQLTAFCLRYLICRWLDPGDTRSSELQMRKKDKSDGVVSIMGESVHLRMASACVSVFFVGIYKIVASGYSVDALYGAVFSMLVAVGAVYFYSGFFDASIKGTPRYEAGSAAVLYTIVFSVSAFQIFGISIGMLAAYVLTLSVGKSSGVLRGAVVGLVAGAAVGLDIAPLLGITGFCSGLLFSTISSATLLASMGIFLLGRLLASGVWGVVGILPEVAIGSLVLLPLIKYDLLPQINVFSDLHEDDLCNARTAVEEISYEERNKRLKDMSECFSKMSSVLYNLSDRLRRPSITELRNLCDRACDKFCPKCSRQSLCWDKELVDTLDMINKLTSQLNRGGRVSPAVLPKNMVVKCKNIEGITDEINYLSAYAIENAIKNDKTEVFALDYEAVSKLLENELERSAMEKEEDVQLSAKVRQSLRGMGLPVSNIAVYGARRKMIIASNVDGGITGNRADELKKCFETACGCRFRIPEFNICGQNFTMTVKQERRYRVESAKACTAKENEDGNGDSAVFFNNREDYFYAFISDGMGSGGEALLTSKLCSLFMENMLNAGNSKNLTLDMLNSLIREKGIECSSTVDLFELDMLSGSASFIKSGAAPSFVRRDGNIFRIQSKTMPIGILRSLDAEEIAFDVEDGDVVIMISDGISQNFEEGLWLLDLLGDGWDDDLDSMAKNILDNAKLNNPRTDDATVYLARICEI